MSRIDDLDMKLRLVLGDQLSHQLSSLRDSYPEHDVILMAEVLEEVQYVNHHKQKLALVFAAMRHFARELRDQGYQVCYRSIEQTGNFGSLDSELAWAVDHYRPDRIVITEPGEWRLWEKICQWQSSYDIPVEIRQDSRFLCSIDEFRDWASGRKSLIMEYFYRYMRQRYGHLMTNDGKPIGGVWNYDQSNRQTLSSDVKIPPRPEHKPDKITQSVLTMVKNQFSGHFGELESFNWPVTRRQALSDCQFFIEQLLPNFGAYQDAMAYEEPFLFHSRLSAALNLGLLYPQELCDKAQSAYDQGKAPINAVEGFVRQILGWREFMRGVYWQYMPDYKQRNSLNAHRDLPGFYWHGRTSMACVAETVRHTRQYAYSHHIQRLMVTGNFALLAGIEPQQVCQWYLEVYADAYEWVELPNTLGMALFGDNGTVASKPYAASGKYINRMSDYCRHCVYDPRQTTGDKACPFNALYWDFLDRNRDQFGNNQRMKLVLGNLRRMATERLQAIKKQARQILDKLDSI